MNVQILNSTLTYFNKIQLLSTNYIIWFVALIWLCSFGLCCQTLWKKKKSIMQLKRE